MTRKEITELLGYSTHTIVSLAVTKAVKAEPEVFGKIYYNGAGYYTSFSVKEVMTILKYVDPPISELKLELIKENIKEPEKRFIKVRSIYQEGNEDFVKKAKKYKYIQACANCAYCIGKSRKGKSDKKYPYCNFYKIYVSRLKSENGKVNIFKDKCETWTRGEPKLFEKV